MQDEVNTKVIALVIKGGRISAEVLEKALKKFVEEIEKAQKQASRPKTYRGKQSIKHLVEQNAGNTGLTMRSKRTPQSSLPATLSSSKGGMWM